MNGEILWEHLRREEESIFESYNLPMLLRGFITITLFAAGFFMNAAAAQVVIPYGEYGSDFKKYLTATVVLVLLGFAAWRKWGRRR